MLLRRRQMLQALGMTALSSLLPRSLRVRADTSSPSRVVFFIQPHGQVPNSWLMPIPDGPLDSVAQRSLRGLSAEDFSPTLNPLFAFRDRLLVVEGLSHTSVMADLAEIEKQGGDGNNHNLAVAGLLTAARALQQADAPCTGGARSIDQELALRTGAPGRFASRVYGASYVPNQVVAPFSFLGAGQPTPIVADPMTSFADLMGYVAAPVSQAMTTREDKLRALRGSVLDAVGEEYASLAPRLGQADRQKLDGHRALVRDLELSLGLGAKAQCELALATSDDPVTPFMRLIRMALACDLTRVVTYVAPVPQCPEFGYPADANVHSSYAHGSVQGNTSCGQTYTPLAERAMTDLSVWYAKHFQQLLQELDSVPEGDGTLLDHTTVVWLTELGTPTHQHFDVFSLLAGGTNRFFEMGRYLRYPRSFSSPHKSAQMIGPAQSQLFVSLLQSMGQADQGFGMESAVGQDGGVVSLRGPLGELHRRG